MPAGSPKKRNVSRGAAEARRSASLARPSSRPLSPRVGDREHLGGGQPAEWPPRLARAAEPGHVALRLVGAVVMTVPSKDATEVITEEIGRELNDVLAQNKPKNKVYYSQARPQRTDHGGHMALLNVVGQCSDPCRIRNGCALKKFTV
jgi:hypothetical protein